MVELNWKKCLRSINKRSWRKTVYLEAGRSRGSPLLRRLSATQFNDVVPRARRMLAPSLPGCKVHGGAWRETDIPLMKVAMVTRTIEEYGIFHGAFSEARVESRLRTPANSFRPDACDARYFRSQRHVPSPVAILSSCPPASSSACILVVHTYVAHIDAPRRRLRARRARRTLAYLHTRRCNDARVRYAMPLYRAVKTLSPFFPLLRPRCAG